ncbi:Cof-type HAD-IIB family hydrolase [Lactobacillus hamsteri]|uniref:HAD family hydrolase n=1 Tax=Lactobacillus hamsteri DSM 5661 = JCM 6256 TaxID=1423754 RepID=A0A0R1YCP2_9LACO|nr:Cof-type HAD-IIB family hydrolase [Lactobacillus hamsteri]KRM37206.1 HAD family hydrolase [Lactobacillus hamsteri DSM 5661 = JCM 6256]
MYKLITCDLDETLLSDNTHVCERNKEAIKKATDLGVKFVPATGRGYDAVSGTLKEIGLYNKENEYVISFNGACVTENKSNQVLRFDGLNYDIANELYKMGKEKDVCIHVYTKDIVYVYNMNDDERKYMEKRHRFEEIDKADLSFIKGQDIPKVLYESTNQEYLRDIAKEMGELANKLDVSYSSNRYLEFNSQGINKGVGLLWLANKLGIKPEETMALGDNFNDLSMIKAAGLGVGMANTNPDMKDQCNIITKADNNQGGVAEAIERFVLNEDNN